MVPEPIESYGWPETRWMATVGRELAHSILNTMPTTEVTYSCRRSHMHPGTPRGQGTHACATSTCMGVHPTQGSPVRKGMA